MNTQRTSLTFFILLLLSTVSLAVALNVGSLHLSLEQTTMMILRHNHTFSAQIIFDLRLPRAIAAFATGGLLALAGTLLQVLLRNPLADPYILGVSGGAAFFNLLAILSGASLAWLNVSAFVGCLVTMLLVFTLAYQKNKWSSQRLLLVGVMIAASWGALISCLLSVSSANHIRNLLYWLMGDLSYAQWPYLACAVLVIGLILSLGMARSLNILTLGELRAKTLGVNTKRLQYKLYFLSALLTACAVTVAGPIAFVGLIVPHILRLLGIADHRFLLPYSVLLGGILLTFSDTLARSLFAPTQIPVGIITTLIGVPVFLFLLRHTEDRTCH